MIDAMEKVCSHVFFFPVCSRTSNVVLQFMFVFGPLVCNVGHLYPD